MTYDWQLIQYALCIFVTHLSLTLYLFSLVKDIDGYPIHVVVLIDGSGSLVFRLDEKGFHFLTDRSLEVLPWNIFTLSFFFFMILCCACCLGFSVTTLHGKS